MGDASLLTQGQTERIVLVKTMVVFHMSETRNSTFPFPFLQHCAEGAEDVLSLDIGISGGFLKTESVNIRYSWAVDKEGRITRCILTSFSGSLCTGSPIFIWGAVLCLR